MQKIYPDSMGQGVQIHQSGEIHRCIAGKEQLIPVSHQTDKIHLPGNFSLQDKISFGIVTTSLKIGIKAELQTLYPLVLNLTFQDLEMSKEKKAGKQPEKEEEKEGSAWSEVEQQAVIQQCLLLLNQ